MFYAYIPLSSYMGTDMGQMPAAAALRLLRLRLRLRLEIPAADRGTVKTQSPNFSNVSKNIQKTFHIFGRDFSAKYSF